PTTHIYTLSLHDALPIYRPNLYYEVRPKRQPAAQLIAYLREHPDASGIIYCLARAETERLAAMLQGEGFSAAAYHAGLSGEERRDRKSTRLNSSHEWLSY